MNQLKCLFMGVLCCLLMLACSPFQPVESKLKHRYALTSYARHLSFKPPSNKTLLVTTPSASPAMQTANIIYLKKPYEIQRFSENVWISPPATMLLPLLVESLRSSGYFKAVVAAPRTALVDVRLDSQLLTLQHEFITRPSQVNLRMQVTLTDSRSNEVLASRRFSTLVPASMDNPYAGVVAANRATEKLTKQITAFVLQYTPHT